MDPLPDDPEELDDEDDPDDEPEELDPPELPLLEEVGLDGELESEQETAASDTRRTRTMRLAVMMGCDRVLRLGAARQERIKSSSQMTSPT